MERLAHSITAKEEEGIWKPIRLSRNGPGLSHLFFADDLVLFAEADAGQMDVIHGVMEEFCLCSGHRVSIAKTQVYFSKNCSDQIRDLVEQRLGFEVVEDLGRYLGVPLLHKRVTKATYVYLLDKMAKRLSGWAAKSLSLAGRITLAKAVLQVIPSYVMQTAVLPKGLCREMEKIIRRFVWGGSGDRRGLSLINWESMQKSLSSGGMGLKNLESQNSAFLMKVGFEILTKPNKLWVRVVKEKYGWHEVVPLCIKRGNCSRLWQGLSRVWEDIRESVRWNIRNGERTDFWYDIWVDMEGPLWSRCNLSTMPDPMSVDCMVDEFGEWDWRRLECLLPKEVLDKVSAIPPPRPWYGVDQPCYRWEENKMFTIRSAYMRLEGDTAGSDSPCWRLLWGLNLPQRIRVFLWLAMRGSLLTNVERMRRHLTSEGMCQLCRQGNEDIDHVLRRCPPARDLWSKLVPPGRLGAFETVEWNGWLELNLRIKGSMSGDGSSWVTCFAVGCWLLWKHRCSKLLNADYVEVGDMYSRCRQLALEFDSVPASVGGCRRNGGERGRWQRPPASWVKANADGSVQGQQQTAAIWGVFRDSAGVWLFGFARAIGSCSVLMSELWAVYDTLLHAWRLGFRKVWLESDNLEVMRILKGESTALSGDALVDLIFGLLCRDWEVRIQHIGREGNKVADFLARWCNGERRGNVWLPDPPTEVHARVLEDSCS
ncbi:hypothetical protein HRI_001112100 [Hibiscus trionum]|uniref:Non-LTR retroelement reverse transcriptase n=1 Tax=Hibiscus trionum TaxID=183268 RepID=A0A9W7HBV0_HIBTR|nr:hypothetical protein HRI_001112100 [Hibiscus trionum]